MKLIIALALFSTFPAIAASRKFDIIDGTGQVVGQGKVTAMKGGSKLSVRLKKAEPGIKAMHIHEKGLCEGPKFTSAGGHFNPTGKKHGHDNPEGAHLGDLNNIEVSAKGAAKKEVELKGLGFEENLEHNFDTPAGASLVIHAKEDDNKTDPAGNAGDRIYCGVISPAK